MDGLERTTSHTDTDGHFLLCFSMGSKVTYFQLIDDEVTPIFLHVRYAGLNIPMEYVIFVGWEDQLVVSGNDGVMRFLNQQELLNQFTQKTFSHRWVTSS